jgi:hypothetical protein
MDNRHATNLEVLQVAVVLLLQLGRSHLHTVRVQIVLFHPVIHSACPVPMTTINTAVLIRCSGFFHFLQDLNHNDFNLY